MGHKNKKYYGNHSSSKNIKNDDLNNPKEEELNANPEEMEAQFEQEVPENNSEPDSENSNELTAEAEDACESAEKKVEALEEQVAHEKKEYQYLMAEFDNFRKRTLKEKSEIIKNAAENVFKGLLPIIDDFERGIKAASSSGENDSVKEGMTLIYNKLRKFMEQHGVKEIDPAETDFDTEKHEAISAVPVPDEAQKGKILDTVEKGYTINDKVLRHAKVVVGQ